MKIAIITAMPQETKAVLNIVDTPHRANLRGLKGVRCSMSGHDIQLMEAGMGFDNAARAAQAVIAEFEPELIISMGLCGGIDPQLRVGDVVVAIEQCIVSNNGVELVPVAVPAASLNFITRSKVAGKRVFGGLFAATPVITPKQRVATLLPPQAPCPVVEMESAAIALVAVEHRIPFAAIRTVSDPADEELGFSLDEFCGDRLRIRPHKVALTILRKPCIIPQLIRLARNSNVAASALSRALLEFLTAL